MKFAHLIPVCFLFAISCAWSADEVLRGSASYSPNVAAHAGSTDRNYITDYDRVLRAAIEAIEEEAHVKESQIERTDSAEGCNCGGQVTYLKAPYIDFSWIKVKIDGRGKDSCMPELSVSITTDKTFFTRHKEYEQRIHELVLLKLRAKKHGEESVPPVLPPIHAQSKGTNTGPAPAPNIVTPPPATPAPAAAPAPQK
jgi:hypothetical protein